MQKLLLFLFVLAAALLAVSYVFYRKVGDIRPVLQSTEGEIEEIFSRQEEVQAQGEEVEFPLQLPEGLRIGLFAKGLGTPRDIVISPEGTVLVSIPEAGQVIAVPDRDGDGQAEETVVVARNLLRPHGLAFYDGKFFIAEETRLVRYSWNENELTAQEEKELLQLPAGGRHRTRTLAFDEDGLLYLSLGSRCDTCFEDDPWIATVIRTNSEGESPEVYSRGLRNAVFLVRRPGTNQIWSTEMGRDFLGDTLPPDEINVLQGNSDFGWPVCYGNRVYDEQFGERTPEHCQTTVPPVFELPAHVAPLGLNFIDSEQFPEEWQGDLLVALHGSWNSSQPVGYKVVRLDIEGQRVIGRNDFLTGFLQGAQALGRPVDLEFDQQGTLFISDDKAGVIYRVTRTPVE